ncbi:MAG TPA: MoxR family ATPase [Chitinophagaceae bacterium]|nr:MoxR family ATPase [Chitinophagaceae bacterium]
MQTPSFIQDVRKELGKVIIGQHNLINRLLIGLMSDGHMLLEGVPGLAKTLSIKSLAKCLDLRFSRIQFTPDLLPADVTGTKVYNQELNKFDVRKGPIFANFILADEINRAPAKVQSALLEAMQERQVTIGEQTFLLDEPFLVLATQNPIEQEGTYPLPEAELDRFMLKIKIDYPNEIEEQLIIRNQIKAEPLEQIRIVTTAEEIRAARKLVRQVVVDEKIEQYIIRIVFATRFPEKNGLGDFKNKISYGASPRASIYLAMAAKANAFMDGRDYVIPDDIKEICKDVLRHRIGLTYEAQADRVSSEDIIDELLQKKVKTP